MKTTIFLFVLITFSSCNIAIMKLTGTKQPKLENYNSIKNYTSSIGIDSSIVLFAKDSTSFMKIGKHFGGFQNVLIFDKNNNFIPYREDSIHCNASIDDILQHICNINTKSITSKKSICIDSLLSLTVFPNRQVSKITEQPYDYILFFDYAKYFHGVNKSHISVWNKILLENKRDCTIKYYYINVDYLDTWQMKSEIPKIKLKPNK